MSDEIDLDSPLPPLPPVRDGRTPGQLVRDDDHRWPADRDGVRKIYLPPHLTGRNRRLFLRQILWAEGRTLPEADEDERRRNFTRAGGDCVCPQCGEKFYDHPQDADEHYPGLNILCDRSRVHL